MFGAKQQVPHGSNATNKRPAARRNSSGRLRVWQDPLRGSALPVFHRPLAARAALKLNMSSHIVKIRK